jgi:hypothetical protein
MTLQDKARIIYRDRHMPQAIKQSCAHIIYEPLTGYKPARADYTITQAVYKAHYARYKYISPAH